MTLNTRKVAVYTSSRAEYGHLYWLLKSLEAHPEIELQLLAGGAHLAPVYGHTIDEIKHDGFHVDAISESLAGEATLEGPSDQFLAKREWLQALEADVDSDVRLTHTALSTTT